VDRSLKLLNDETFSTPALSMSKDLFDRTLSMPYSDIKIIQGLEKELNPYLRKFFLVYLHSCKKIFEEYLEDGEISSEKYGQIIELIDQIADFTKVHIMPTITQKEYLDHIKHIISRSKPLKEIKPETVDSDWTTLQRLIYEFELDI
jgi:hypothetical protein